MGMEFVLQAIKHKLIILINHIAGVMQNDSVLILEICLPLIKKLSKWTQNVFSGWTGVNALQGSKLKMRRW